MSGKFNTIDDFNIEDKTVLVRIDVNSPVDPSSGIILDDTIGEPGIDIGIDEVYDTACQRQPVKEKSRIILRNIFHFFVLEKSDNFV